MPPVMTLGQTVAQLNGKPNPSRGLTLGCTLGVWLVAGLIIGCRQEAPRSNHLPPAIADIEESAEDIFDLANAAQWNRAETRTHLLRGTIARLEASQGRQLPDLENAIAELDRAIESRDVARSRRSANAMMRLAVTLGSDRLENDSATILMLDVETRAVLIDLDDNPQAANAAVARIVNLWKGLRPEVEKRGDRALADRCDDQLRNLQEGSAAIRRSEAEALLETIDRLEDLFS